MFPTLGWLHRSRKRTCNIYVFFGRGLIVWGVCSHHIHLLEGILSTHETHKVEKKKWVKYYLWLSHPFKASRTWGSPVFFLGGSSQPWMVRWKIWVVLKLTFFKNMVYPRGKWPITSHSNSIFYYLLFCSINATYINTLGCVHKYIFSIKWLLYLLVVECLGINLSMQCWGKKKNITSIIEKKTRWRNVCIINTHLTLPIKYVAQYQLHYQAVIHRRSLFL